ncbi:MAG: PilZ domain-containing protein [Rhizobiales bacterium]|nr:PilZ domain-containing protein [Hyphomicrobiales bacterium]
MAVQDKRKGPRRSFERPAWIVIGKGDGRERVPCHFRDLSDHGARLMVPPQIALPASFELHFVQNGSVARKCDMMWRSEANDEVGVAFTAKLIQI